MFSKLKNDILGLHSAFSPIRGLTSLASLAFLSTSSHLQSQTVFSVPGANPLSFNLFEQLTPGGAITPVSTGFDVENFGSISRDGRFITFSSPDAIVSVNQVASSDLYRFDRATGQTIKIHENETLISSFNGRVTTTTAAFNSMSPDGTFVIMNEIVEIRENNLSLVRSGSDLVAVPTNGGLSRIIEMGNSNDFDFLRAEFIGISWAPDSRSFVTSGYVSDPNSPNGLSLGIIEFTRDGNDTFSRSRVFSRPSSNITAYGISSNYQIYPAISPSGAAIAYFSVFAPDSAFLSQPFTASIVVDSGNGPQVRHTLPTGLFPSGLTWSADGTQLIFSYGQQMQSQGPGTFNAPSTRNGTEVVRAIASFGQDTTVRQLSGINVGLLPSFPIAASPSNLPNDPPADLSSSNLSVTRASSGSGLTLQAENLEVSRTYTLRAATDLNGTFSSVGTYTGTQIMNGISLPMNGPKRFYRLEE